MTQIKRPLGPIAADVDTLLSRLNLAPGQDCLFLGVPATTLKHWRMGTREPGAVTARLLDVLRTIEVMAPDLFAALTPPAPAPAKRGRPFKVSKPDGELK